MIGLRGGDEQLLFIINHRAGNGKGLEKWREIEHELLAMNVPYEALLCTSAEETKRQLTRKIKEAPIQTVGVIGGDGTVHSVLQVIANTTIGLAVFPTGSGNDIANMFRLTTKPKSFVQQLLKRTVQVVDLLEVNGHFGLTVSGVGLDATIGQLVNEAPYKKWLNRMKLNSLSYIIGVLHAVVISKPFQAKITLNGETTTYENTWLIACGNTQFYGGGLMICPTADPTDGRFNTTIFHTLPKLLAFTKIFPALLRQKIIHESGVTYEEGSSVYIETNPPMPAMIDGEIVTETPIHIQLHARALRLYMTTI